jgi:hypothetical protein
MEYSIDHEGRMLLVTSPREADIIAKSLISKQLEMRKTQARQEYLDEVLSIMLSVNSAMMDSNKARLSATKNTEPQTDKEVYVVEPKRSFRKRVYEFFNLRLTTEDFEEARTACGIKHVITSMDFDNVNFPNNVKGEVFHEGRWRFVAWDEYGKCTATGIADAHCYDLILPDHGKKTSAKCIVLAATVFFIVLIIYAIIQ